MSGSHHAIQMQEVGAGIPQDGSNHRDRRATVMWAERAIHPLRGQNGVMVKQHPYLLYPGFRGGSPLQWLTLLDQTRTLSTKCVDAFYYPE